MEIHHKSVNKYMQNQSIFWYVLSIFGLLVSYWTSLSSNGPSHTNGVAAEDNPDEIPEAGFFARISAAFADMSLGLVTSTCSGRMRFPDSQRLCFTGCVVSRPFSATIIFLRFNVNHIIAG